MFALSFDYAKLCVINYVPYIKHLQQCVLSLVSCRMDICLVPYLV